ncbi:PHD finger protein rhinoceros [Cloeon dipterum]|uniref:PHD finger protein rhinoceros n=1 Tax=Cloeon dipterum TaxID=197152 RepID=UPI0032203440
MFEPDLLELQEFAVWVVSFSVFIMLVAFFGCVCGCKKKNGDKDDWLGKEGKLKPLNNLDEDQALQSNGEAQRVANRASTANRSLPDIPINELRDTDPTWDLNQLTNTSDNCSELYATVGETPNSELEAKSKKRQAPSIPSPENSPSESAPVGSKVLAHQYAKLSHPYARVKPPPPKNDAYASTSTVTQPSMELESSENTPGTQGGSQTTLSSGTDQPIPPPRTRRSSSQSNLFHASSSSPTVTMARSANTLPSYPASSSPALVLDSIPAGPAIMGKISASQELPYITLPIDNARSNHVPVDLPNAEGEVGAVGNDVADNAGAADDVDQRNPGAGHFSGDSQDSSKGYTSISVREPLASIRAQTGQLSRRTDPHYATVSDDSDEMYAAIEDRSGSDTYAQIVPLPQQQPPPPSVDSLRNTLAENHSRQASSSSAASTAATVGSPKPEKRQANSPLPPPPAVPPPNVSPPLTPSPLPQSKLEEMYAKVIKKKGSKESTPTHSAAKEGASRTEPGHASLDLNSGYESLPSGRPPVEPNYESMSSSIPDNDSASGYAVVALKNPNYPGYEEVRNSNRTSFHQQSDPNYEELGHKSDSSVHEPNYEMLNGEPNYEPLKSNSSAQDDPNYESVLSLREPPYEQLDKKATDSSGDLIYATVNKSNKKAL